MTPTKRLRTTASRCSNDTENILFLIAEIAVQTRGLSKSVAPEKLTISSRLYQALNRIKPPPSQFEIGNPKIANLCLDLDR